MVKAEILNQNHENEIDTFQDKTSLYLVHCGFYDNEISDGIYEFHVNIPVIAVSIRAAKDKIRTHPLFQKKKMHIDGIQEIQKVEGVRISFDSSSDTATVINNIPYRDL